MALYCLKINGRTVSDQQLISEQFNEFFCSIGANLASKFDNSAPSSFSRFLKCHVSLSIYLDVPHLTEIINVFNSLNINKAVGYDSVSPFFLRIASTVLVPYIQVFIDCCFANDMCLSKFNCVSMVTLKNLALRQKGRGELLMERSTLGRG